jgi:signal transduction histidine kinase
VRHKNRPLVVPDIFTNWPHLKFDGLAATPAYVGVPIHLEGNVLGVLSLFTQTLDHFSADDIVLLAAMADHVGSAVERVRLSQRAEQTAVMEERQRLARELHDSVTQSLYSLVLFAEAGHDAIQAGRLAQLDQYLGQLGKTAQQALREMRLLIYELRPLALMQAGLVEALRQRLETVERRAGLEPQLQVDLPVELPVPVEVGLYRISQEALNNVLKHSQAGRVSVFLSANNSSLRLEVADNGRGFAPECLQEKGGFGLATMRERAEKLGGMLQIISQPGRGTQIIVTLPHPETGDTL